MLSTYLFLCVVSLPSILVVSFWAVKALEVRNAMGDLSLTDVVLMHYYTPMRQFIGWQFCVVVTTLLFHYMQWDARWMAVPCGITFLTSSFSYGKLCLRNRGII
jgi:hypothetical protein